MITSSGNAGPSVELAGRLHGFRDGKRSVVLMGELDCSRVRDLASELVRLAGDADEIVLDVKEVSFVDLACLRMIVRFAQEFQGDGRRVTVVGAHDEVKRIMHLTGASFLLPT